MIAGERPRRPRPGQQHRFLRRRQHHRSEQGSHGEPSTGPAFVASKPSTVRFTITDTGNVPIVGTASVEFFAGTDMTIADATSLVIMPLRVNLKPGASHARFRQDRLPTTLPARQYFLLCLLDPSDVLSDTNSGNNLLVSGNMFTVGG